MKTLIPENKFYLIRLFNLRVCSVKKLNYCLAHFSQSVQKKIKANSKKQTQMLAIASQWFKLNHINRYQSISHSGNYCICIDAAFPVGIDLESIDRKVNWKKIQQRFFTKKEQHLIHDQVTFTKAWTKKEALYKMLDQFTNTTKWTDLTTCSKKYHFVTKQIDDKYLFTFCF